MAAAKKPSSKVGTAVSTKLKSNIAVPADYEAQVAADVDAFKSRLAVAETNLIQVTQDKKFKLPGSDDTVKVDTIVGIIVDFAAHKAYYEQAFDRDNPIPPTCFAVGMVAHKSLFASESSPECQSESGACNGCPKYKFEKNPAGKWIAPECKDNYTLALLAPDDNGEGKLMKLKLSSTAVREFEKYVRTVQSSKPGRTLYNVLTEFSFDPSSDYPSIRCMLVDDVPRAGMGLVMSCRPDASNLVMMEPSIDEWEEKVLNARGKTKAGAKKPALASPRSRASARA